MQAPPPEPPSTEQQQRYIEVWAKAVDTQMHFNEMSVKSRQLGLTFVAAALGVAVVLMTRGNEYAILIPENDPSVRIHIGVILVLGALLALLAVRTLDLNVYHKMLRGAVTFGEDFEEHYMKKVFNLNKGMTQAISHFSRYRGAKVSRDRDPERYIYELQNESETETPAENKIRSFYNYATLFLFGAAIVLFILTNLDIWIGPTGSETSPTTVESSP